GRRRAMAGRGVMGWQQLRLFSGSEWTPRSRYAIEDGRSRGVSRDEDRLASQELRRRRPPTPPVPVAPWQILAEAPLSEADFADSELSWFAQGEAQEAADERRGELLVAGPAGHSRAWLSKLKWKWELEPA